MFRYLPDAYQIQVIPQPGNQMRIEGKINGHDYHNTGYLRADKANRHIEWGLDGEDNYRGWLDVHPSSYNTASELVAHVSLTPPAAKLETLKRQNLNFEEVILAGLNSILLSIGNFVEKQSGKVEPEVVWTNE